MNVVIRRAEPAELDLVQDILAEASAWIASKGIRQWPPRFPDQQTAKRIARGSVYLALVEDEPVATITLDTFADPEFWTDDGQALYAHRLAVRRRWAGQGIGKVLLDWASERTRTAGRRWLRLDANKDNPGLREYYKTLGFHYVDEIDLPHRRSGALFEKSVEQ